jgi:hypothetical protein
MTWTDFHTWLKTFPWGSGYRIPIALIVLAVLWWPGTLVSLLLLVGGWIISRSHRTGYRCDVCSTDWSYDEARINSRHGDA